MKIWGSGFLTNSFKKVAGGVRSVRDFAVHHCQAIAAAFGAHSTMDHKTYHATKLVVLAVLCVASAATFNIEGAIGSGIATVDELSELEEIGKLALKAKPPELKL